MMNLQNESQEEEDEQSPGCDIVTLHLVTRKYFLNEASTRRHVLAADPSASKPFPTVSHSSTDPISEGSSWKYCS